MKATGYSEENNIKAYLPGRDVFVSAPTGAGKSVTLEQASCTFDLFWRALQCHHKLLIVPLISLLIDQVSNLNSCGVRASSYLGDDCSEKQLKDFLNRKEKPVYSLPYGNPGCISHKSAMTELSV